MDANLKCARDGFRTAWLSFLLASSAFGCGGPPFNPTAEGTVDLALPIARAPGDFGLASSDLASSALPDLSRAPTAYPAGPYGNKAGDVFPLLHWIGYVDPAADAQADTKPYVTYSSADLFASGRSYALVTLAEVYCSGCQASARLLATEGKPFVDAGGVIVEILISNSGAMGQAVTESDLKTWIDTYALPVTSIKDPDGMALTTFNDLGYWSSLLK